LQISGIDTFLACQADSFFGVDGRTAPGFSWVATVVAGVPSFAIEPGALGSGLVRAAHAYWRACADAGIDQVIDDVWLQRDWAQDLQTALAGIPVIWVGVRCPIHVLEQRERDRGDRTIGQARGHADVVHQWMPYDVEIDSSQLLPHEAASLVIDAVIARTGIRCGNDGLWPAQNSDI
jgi:chloramphenicol 3-O phosphotransferase